MALVGSMSCGRTDPGFAGPYRQEAASAGLPNPMAGGGYPGGGRPSGDAGKSSGGASMAGGKNGVGAGGASIGDHVEVRLRGAPLVFAPTAGELGLNVALASGDPAALRARARAEGEDWRSLIAPRVRAPDVAEWQVTGLEPGTRYEYQVVDARAGDAPITLYSGRAV